MADHPQPLVGRCFFMCPVAERQRREELQQLSMVEVDHSCSKLPGKKGRAAKLVSSSSLAVKEYVRAGAGHHVPGPDELRPPDILMETMDYLMNSVIVREDLPWYTLYGFVNNRCQSVRQDITYQQLEGPEVVHIYKLAVRFYIYAQYRLAGEGVERFDPKLNGDQLQQCLSKLLRLCRNETHSQCETKSISQWAEIESYYLLTNLGSDEAAMHTLSLPSHIRSKPVVQTAIKLNHLAGHNNFVHIFKLFRQLPPLGKCAVYRYIQALRRKGLQILCSAYCVGRKPSPFPLRVIAQWFMFDGEQEAEEYCTSLGLRVVDKNTLLLKFNLQLSPLEVLHSNLIPEASHATCRQLITMPN